MPNPSEISSLLDRIANGTHTNADLTVFRDAIDSGQITFAPGENAVSIGRDAIDTIIITGDRNLVIKDIDSELIHEILRGFRINDDHIEINVKLRKLSKAGEVLFEWKTLHDKLQHIQSLLNLAMNVTGDSVDLAWQQVVNLIEGDLLQFASQIQYIGCQYQLTENGIIGEEWAVKISSLQKDSSDALTTGKYSQFKEYVRRMQNLILIHISQSNNQLVKTSEIIDTHYGQIQETLSKSSQIDTDLLQLDIDVFFEKRVKIKELVVVHNLLDRLHIEMSRYRAWSRDKEFVDMVKSDWGFINDFFVEKLFEEARRFSFVLHSEYFLIKM